MDWHKISASEIKNPTFRPGSQISKIELPPLGVFSLINETFSLSSATCIFQRSNTASASAATTSHPWRPSPVPQGRSFHRTVDRNDPGAPAATHQGRRCVSASPVAPCSGGPHSVWPGYMCCSACTAESTAQGSTVHLKRIPEGPCAKGRRRHGAH